MVKSKYAKRYPKEFRHQMVELHRAGRTLSDLARQFGPTPWAISLVRLRRENKRLQMEREILAKAAAWLCVQRRQRHSAGNRPVGVIVRTP